MYIEEAIPANCASTPTSTVNVGVDNQIGVFPNPSADEINVPTEQNFDGYFEVYSLVGEQLLQSLAHQIDVRSLHQGAYILVKRYSDGRVKSYPFIKNSDK